MKVMILGALLRAGLRTRAAPVVAASAFAEA